ncbi:ArnT family glycosyltransferase [Lewinella sp. LCG006]|uniref:ArnT family glycosyltransferase n=1 Tax=Lewinella sp. LCG006 TaxID=3231911 RepID=UPI00345F1BF2
MRQIDWSKWALPALLFLAVLLRWGTFFPSVINHDESTYFLIGKGLLEGQTYLVDSYDTKPVGIFLIYALMSWLGGGAIFFLRLFTALVIGLTAYLLYLLGNSASGNTKASWAAAISYLLLTSIFKFYGISPNTELFFNPFTLGALLLVWGEGRKIHHFLLAGLLLGAGFMIKYVIAADALAIGLFLLWQGWRKERIFRTILQECLPLTLVFFLPLALTYGYYASIGQTEAFLFYTFDVTSKYPVEASWVDRLLFALAFFGRFFPFTLLAIFALREPLAKDRTWQGFLLLWLGCVTVMTLLPGKTFGHYQIQMMPPLALLAALWFDPERKQQGWLRKAAARWIKPFMVVAFVGISVGLFFYFRNKLDGPRLVAAALKERLAPGELVYTGNYHHIVYHLLGQQGLTPYVHSSLLFYDHHVEALEIDLTKEAKRILDQHPRFILLRTDHPHNLLTNSIYERYEITDTLPDKVWLLEPIN